MEKRLSSLVIVFVAASAMAFGPRTSVEDFFAKRLDTSVPELAEIPALMEKGDVKAAEKVFADHVRATMQTDKIIDEWLNRKYSPGALSNLTARAKSVMDYTLVSCRIPHHFADHKVDWLINPTPDKYKEWTRQLNRFDSVMPLGEYYVATHDEAAVPVWMDLVESWLEQSPVPDQKVGSHATDNWRTIDASCRIGNWNRLFPAFLGSPQITDDFITRFCISVWEHGWRLRAHTTQGNWLLGELDALMQISTFYPYLKDAREWGPYSRRRRNEEVLNQFYPDGFHYELTTAYHGAVTLGSIALQKFYLKFGPEPSSNLTQRIERMFEVYTRICRPNWTTPSLNDGEQAPIDRWCALGLSLFPQRQDFLWFATRGRHGAMPEFLSYAFPYAGAIIFRDSWGPDAIWAYMDASPYGRGHQHEDKLNFLLDAYGKTMLTEGGNYIYDDSPMRKYALSTRSHNTIRIDGCDQSQWRTYRWRNEDINKKADFEFETHRWKDRARASFKAGYGHQGIKAAHDRTALFLKWEKDLKPFFVIVDRISASDEKRHRYEVLWHFEESDLSITNATFTADFGGGVGLFAATSAANATIKNKKGQVKPELQGWMPVWDVNPHEDRKIPTVAVEGSFSNTLRIVTLLYPYRDGDCPIVGVRASDNPEATDFALILADGSERKLDENDELFH